MAEQMTRIMIADDDQVFREALADLVSGQSHLELVGAAVDHPDAIRLAVSARPQVALLDARMPGGIATTTVRAIRDQAPNVEVLVLSAYEDAESALELLDAGVAGYLVKGVADEEILQAVARAVRGQLSISTSLAIECMRLVRGRVESGRKAHAAALHDDSMLRQVLDRVPFAVLLVAKDGRVVLANARVQALVGRRRTELVGEHITTVVPQFQPDEPANESIGRILNRKPPDGDVPEARFTTTARHKDGADLPVEVSVSQLSLGLNVAAVFLRDINESLAAEGRHHRLFLSAPDATVVVDSNGTIQQVNAAAERLFGFLAAELVDRSVDILLPGHPVAYRRKSDEIPARLGGPAIGEGPELVGRRRDGTEFPVDMSIARILTGEGQQVMLAIRDMTKLVEARAALEGTIEELRSTGRQQRNTIVELIRAQERERMGVAAGIHDDSLQVVTAAALRLQQLRRRLHDPEDLKILSKLDETIMLAAERLRRMIFDFRPPPALEQDGLVAALSVYLDQLQSDTGLSYQLEADIVAEPPEEAGVVIYRIAQEALMNVRKHARASRVRVRLSQVDDGYLTEIGDDGVGFDPLQEEPGSGHLGLTLMRDRAEVVGGWCRITGVPGVGTTVEVWIPEGAAVAPRGQRVQPE
jgi:PAS domain S-box-containing protein